MVPSELTPGEAERRKGVEQAPEDPSPHAPPAGARLLASVKSLLCRTGLPRSVHCPLQPPRCPKDIAMVTSCWHKRGLELKVGLRLGPGLREAGGQAWEATGCGGVGGRQQQTPREPKGSAVNTAVQEEVSCLYTHTPGGLSPPALQPGPATGEGWLTDPLPGPPSCFPQPGTQPRRPFKTQTPLRGAT